MLVVNLHVMKFKQIFKNCRKDLLLESTFVFTCDKM